MCLNGVYIRNAQIFDLLCPKHITAFRAFTELHRLKSSGEYVQTENCGNARFFKIVHMGESGPIRTVVPSFLLHVHITDKVLAKFLTKCREKTKCLQELLKKHPNCFV